MIKREPQIFLIVGSLTVFVDFLAYRGLIWTGLLEINSAKAIGFLAGTVFAYCANRFWTFGHKKHAPGSVWRFVLLYTLTLGSNVFVNAIGLRMLDEVSPSVLIAFLIATGVSATLNFIGMKYFVFKARVTLEDI